MKLFGDLLYILMRFSFTYMQQFIRIHPDLYLSSLQSFFDWALSEMEYKNTTWVDLPEVNFSFHEDNHKVKEMTAQGFLRPPSFPLTSFIFFLLIYLGGRQLSIKDASWSPDVTLVISLTLRLYLSKEKSISGKSTLVVFLYHHVLRVHQILQKVEMNGCYFQQVLQQNLGWFLSEHRKTVFLRGFILKPTQKAQVLLENYTRDFQNNPLFKRLICFYVKISGNFEFFQYFNFEIDFLENENFVQKTGVPLFS